MLLQKLILRAILGLLLLGFISCGSSDMEPVDTEIASVEILPNDESIISIEQEVQLELLATNAAGDEVASGAISWDTSDPGILMVSTSGVMRGINPGTASISAMAGGKSDGREFRVVDLTGLWIGGEIPDTVSYNLVQTGTNVEGVFQSKLGFPPITDVNTGTLTGSLQFSRYQHTLKLTTEDGCLMQIAGPHFVQIENGGEVILVPGMGDISSSNCSIFGTIDFTTLRRQ